LGEWRFFLRIAGVAPGFDGGIRLLLAREDVRFL
jgi:hypothetical protein